MLKLEAEDFMYFFIFNIINNSISYFLACYQYLIKHLNDSSEISIPQFPTSVEITGNFAIPYSNNAKGKPSDLEINKTNITLLHNIKNIRPTIIKIDILF